MLILARPTGSVTGLALAYAAMAGMALGAPVSARTGRLLHPAAALAVGVAAVAVAPLVAGPAPAVRAAGAVAIALNTAAAVSEEALFRRVLYGRLERYGAVVAVAGSAILFAAVHVPMYGVAAFPVDLGAGLLLGWQRWASGSWTVAAATHAWANLVAVIS